MTKVKICGVNSEAAFDAACEVGADWLGFVFFPGSPRCVTPEAASRLSARMKGGPSRVGLFVDPSASAIEQTLSRVHLDILQIYLRSPPSADIERQFPQQVWRPFGVSAPEDLPSDAKGADKLVIEARPPAGAKRPGGNATSFDWSIMRGWKPPAPWILAGGLTPHNVAYAIRETGALAVDVSSGVEVSVGVKDANLIKAFVLAAKSLSEL
jgi:phosphoribosylanthranilate isomerase